MSIPQPPELVVTNLNRNFTGVSATADQLLRYQEQQFRTLLAGYSLPAVQCQPISIRKAIAASKVAPSNRPYVIWHVRRNIEMFWAIFARDVLRYPIKTVFTSAAIRRHSAYPRYLISKMDAVVATSEKAAQLVPNVVRVVPHGVDIERFEPVEKRANAWQATGFPGTQGIATLGRVRPEKGTDLFVDSMIRLLPEHPGFTALVIGKADVKNQKFQAELQEKIKSAGLEDRILFTGELPKESLPGILSALSLFVALPRYEGYGMTPLEAMASGTPVVVSDTGAFSSFVANGKSGRLVPLDDLESSCQAISEMLTDPETLANMSLGARETAVEQFSVSRELAGLEEVYHELWESNPTNKIAA